MLPLTASRSDAPAPVPPRSTATLPVAPCTRLPLTVKVPTVPAVAGRRVPSLTRVPVPAPTTMVPSPDSVPPAALTKPSGSSSVVPVADFMVPLWLSAFTMPSVPACTSTVPALLKTPLDIACVPAEILFSVPALLKAPTPLMGVASVPTRLMVPVAALVRLPATTLIRSSPPSASVPALNQGLLTVSVPPDTKVRSRVPLPWVVSVPVPASALEAPKTSNWPVTTTSPVPPMVPPVCERLATVMADTSLKLSVPPEVWKVTPPGVSAVLMSKVPLGNSILPLPATLAPAASTRGPVSKIRFAPAAML